MKFLMFNGQAVNRLGYMDENGGNGGEGGGGSGGGTGGGAGGQGGEGGAGGEGGGAGGSAFAQKGGEGGEGGSAFAQKGAGKGGEEEKEPTREELAAMSDEDWAKGVLPDDKDAEGHDIDRTFMTNMAKVCREAGISPKMMQKMSGRFQELAKAEMQKQDAARAEAQKQLDAANAAATKAAIEKFDDRQWEDIRAAGAKYIPAGSELAKLMEGPLGSNVELLSILNVVGKSLRSAAPDATGAAGSGEHDAGLAVAHKTVRPGVLD